MTEHICELTPIDSETWETTIGVEVVRCRDCRWCVKKGYRLYCELNAGGFPEVEPDGFCAWGERTEDERMEERTKTEQNGAGITDELREYADGWRDRSCHEHLLAIADRIDAEHEAACAKAYGNGVMSVPIALDESQWVKLPVDADGVPIHIGDRVEWSNGSFTVHELKLTEDGWQTWDSEHGYTVHAYECIRHVQPDSWERIIEDACDMAFICDDDAAGKAELVERCKRLAGESE